MHKLLAIEDITVALKKSQAVGKIGTKSKNNYQYPYFEDCPSISGDFVVTREDLNVKVIKTTERKVVFSKKGKQYIAYLERFFIRVNEQNYLPYCLFAHTEDKKYKFLYPDNIGRIKQKLGLHDVNIQHSTFTSQDILEIENIAMLTEPCDELFSEMFEQANIAPIISSRALTEAMILADNLHTHQYMDMGLYNSPTPFLLGLCDDVFVKHLCRAPIAKKDLFNYFKAGNRYVKFIKDIDHPKANTFDNELFTNEICQRIYSAISVSPITDCDVTYILSDRRELIPHPDYINVVVSQHFNLDQYDLFTENLGTLEDYLCFYMARTKNELLVRIRYSSYENLAITISEFTKDGKVRPVKEVVTNISIAPMFDSDIFIK